MLSSDGTKPIKRIFSGYCIILCVELNFTDQSSIMNPGQNIIELYQKLFRYYKSLGEKSMNQLEDAAFFWQPNAASNSIAIIVQHLSGNMLSRFTDFYTSDGEKPGRNRDSEFEHIYQTAAEVWDGWNKGWNCLLEIADNLKEENLTQIVYIRNEGHTVLEAVGRQLAHYSYHTGQIVYIAKSIKDKEWQTLSIPKGGSKSFNDDKFGKEASRKFFTEK